MERPVNTAFGRKLRSWSPAVGPVVVAVVVGAGAILNREQPDGWLWVALGASSLTLLVRHRWPLGVLAVVLAVMLALNAQSVAVLPALVALLTVVEYRGRPSVVGATTVTAAVMVAVGPLHGASTGWSEVVLLLIAVALPVAVGLYLRARADYIGGLRQRAEQLERERELLAELAVAEERARIARELHDVVAHNVALMVVQAQALATSTGEDQQRVGLGRLAGLGRGALSEMHRMLDVMRLQDGGGPDREPQPGVRDLPGLVEQIGEAGLEATLEIEGEVRELAAGVDLSAYRIVQEALTNVVKHARAERVGVVLEYGRREVVVTVTDDGIGRAPARVNGSSGGHGLVGMRERVALFGGGLHAGARTDGPGYRIRASLPTD